MYHYTTNNDYSTWYTVDVERFTGLNIRSFNPPKVFAEILLRCLGQNCLLLHIIKERCLYSWKNFHGILEIMKTVKVILGNLSMFTVLFVTPGFRYVLEYQITFLVLNG